MSQEIEEIKKILLKYNPTIKEKLDAGLVESKSAYQIEEFLNEIVNEVPDIDMMDTALIVNQILEHNKKYYYNLRIGNIKK